MNDVRCLQWCLGRCLQWCLRRCLQWCLGRCLQWCLDRCLGRCLLSLGGIEIGNGAGSILGNFCVFLSFSSLLKLLSGLLSLGFHTISKFPSVGAFGGGLCSSVVANCGQVRRWVVIRHIILSILSSVTHFHCYFFEIFFIFFYLDIGMVRYLTFSLPFLISMWTGRYFSFYRSILRTSRPLFSSSKPGTGSWPAVSWH